MEAATAVHGLTRAQLDQQARERLESGFGRAGVIYRTLLEQGRFAPEEAGLSARSVRAWREAFHAELPEVVSTVREEEEGAMGPTAKAVLRVAGGWDIECVSIPMGRGRSTLCVSSQVGCKMGCTFCETAKMGLVRHLSAAEIVGQILVAKHVLGWPVRNIVFMGMGEALDNPDALLQAIRVLNDPSGMAIGQERLTVCTVGRVDGIERLQAEGLKRVNLSVSLNAPTDAVRQQIMPVARKYDLGSLQAALAAYRPRRNFTLGVNYCLMPGLNDSAEDARGVAAFCAPIPRVLVNVIGYNPGTDPLTRAPSDAEIDGFIALLREQGLPVRKRITKGRSVMAACGQLGDPSARRRRRHLSIHRAPANATAAEAVAAKKSAAENAASSMAPSSE